MPDLPLTNSEPERHEAERLSQVWNALVRGDSGAIAALDPADAAVVARLAHLAREPRPRPAFVAELKEQLMKEHLTMESSFPITLGGLAGREPSGTPTPPPRQAVPDRARRRWDRPLRGLGAVATAALIIIGLAIGYLAFSALPPGGDGNRETAQFLAPASPEASPAPCVKECPDYWPAAGPARLVGHVVTNNRVLSRPGLRVTKAQLQDWTVAPGATIEVPADGASRLQGAIVDVVLDGIYAVTIDGPAVISRNADPVRRLYEYPEAGTTVELGRGDTIAYPAGRARTIANPLSTTALHFKSAVFYEGNVALTRPADPQPAGLRVRVEGDGTIPAPIADSLNSEVVVELDYIQIITGTTLPDRRGDQYRVIGPVDPQAGPEGQEGYVLWVGLPRG